MALISFRRPPSPPEKRNIWAAWERGEIDVGEFGNITQNGSRRIVGDYLAQSLRLGVVYGCVSLIAARISSLPVMVMRRDGTRLMEADNRQPWIDRPDPFAGTFGLSRHDLLTAIVSSLLLDGNAFLAINRDAASRVVEIQPMDPHKVSISKNAATGIVDLLVNGEPPEYEIRVIRNIVLPGQLRGLSPVDAARETLRIGFGVQTQSSKFFDQGAMLSGVITSKDNLTDEQMEAMAKSWQRKYGGVANAHIPLILESADYKPISVSPEAAQFLETRRFTDAQIAAQIFHCDPSLLGITSEGSSTTYQNIGQRNRQLLDDALLPIMVRIQRCFSQLLPPGQHYKFDTTEFLAADSKSRWEQYQIAAAISQMLGGQAITIAEIREREGMTTTDIQATPPTAMPAPATDTMENQ